jgi:fucose permease
LSDSGTERGREYSEESYRWVIIGLVSLSFAINNIANNAIIPIASKIIKVYSLDETYANLPIQIGFLINPIMNFTCGSIVDQKGLGVSFRIGALLYAVGLFGFVLINYGYFYVLIGAILISIGQPLIMNSPAKVACFWFSNKNVKIRNNLENFGHWSY